MRPGISSETAHPLVPIDQAIWSPRLDHLIEVGHGATVPCGTRDLFIDSMDTQSGLLLMI